MVQGLESILLLGNGSCSYPWILIILLSVAWVSQSNPLHFANWKHLIRMVLYNQESSLQFIHQAGSWSCCNAPLISYTCLSKESALFGDFLFFKFFIFCFDRLWPWKYEFVKQAEKKKPRNSAPSLLKQVQQIHVIIYQAPIEWVLKPHPLLDPNFAEKNSIN